MRDLIRSMVHLSVAMPTLAMKQATEMWKARGTTESLARDLDSVSQAVEGQLEGRARDIFDEGVRLEREVFGDAKAAEAEPSASQPASAPAAVDAGDIDVRTIVVLGEGLAAGFGDFTLAEEYQRESFAAQLAAQIGRPFTQPAIESPGLGEAPGFARLPVSVPAFTQTTVLSELGRRSAPHNLSVPGFRVSDAAGLRPSQPLVRQDDARQTLANLILGLPELLDGSAAGASQLERAVALEPTLALVELGFYEVLEAAVAGRPGGLPDVAAFRADYERVVSGLRKAGAAVMLLTIPDPLDTAYFSTIDSAAANLRVTAPLLVKAYELAHDDQISIPGLVEMGFQITSDSIGSLPVGAVVKDAVVAQVSERVRELNEVIQALAAAHQAEVFDLAALLHGVAENGVQVGARKLSADFLGGFYLLNGYYPGATGQAYIANAILDQLNRDHHASFRAVDLEKVLQRDPAAGQRPAGGPAVSGADLKRTATGVTEVASRRLDSPGSGARRTARASKSASKGAGKAGAKATRLELPPGLQQSLPLSRAASYFGDAIRAVNCREADDQMFGGGRELLFGGLALGDSHLSGELSFRFSDPVGDVTHFEVRHGVLDGEDGTLAAPQFFKLPMRRNEVRDDAKLVSQGDLNLATGEVTNLKWAVRFGNTALMALVRVNPKLPNVPIEFPGLYGSAWARFEQREDGLLDFSFYGTTFLPLGGAMDGDPVRFPLPFAGPTLEFASIVAPGTALHPHLCLSTKEPEAPADPALVPEIPVNTVREYTLYTHNTSFGDKFTLHSPELAGDPTGRSQLLGRLQVQFGAPSGDSVPVAVSCLSPGGMLAEPMPNPLAEMFPGRLAPSPIGHNEFLRFSTRSYYLDALTCIDDPFDVSVGNVSRSTGRFLSELLHRALIGQNLFYALIRVEQRTPKSSFYFRGPAHFEKGKDGRDVFRFTGQVTVPYPEGYLFPSPDMAMGVKIGHGSVLDPFYWIQAMQHDRDTKAAMKGAASKVLSSANELFSYAYELSGDPARPSRFEYTNHTLDSVFQLKSLSWVSFVNSRGAGAPGEGYDTVTFAGFGTWSRDASGALHVVCGQISEASGAPYVSIQVGGGRVSNVNTKPPKLDDVRP